jgi:ParB family transcriptional regulator, chromosome partitioning protein
MHTTVTKRKTTKKSPIVDIDGEQSLMKALGTHEQLQSEGNALVKLHGLNDKRVVSIELKHLVPNMQNRDLENDASIEELAASIESLGQIEPATVRKIGNKFELLSGERRYRACKKLNRPLDCIIVEDSNTDGLVRLAAANSNRRDLNAIERADIMERLMKPIKEGGSGLSRFDAGKAVGLSSESAAKNALRFAKLPPSIKKLIIDGTLSERAARRLIPFASLPAALDLVAAELMDSEQWRREEAMLSLLVEDTFPTVLEDAIEELTRPMDKRVYRGHLVKGHWTNHPKLFEGDQGLNVLTFDVDKERWLVTTDVKKWEDLQRPLVEAIVKGEKKNSSAKSGQATKKGAGGEGAKPKPPTAAELKKKRAESDKKLANWARGYFVPAALRCFMAQYPTVDRDLLLPWLIESHNSYAEAYDAAIVESNIATEKGSYLPTVQDDRASDKLNETLWRVLLWPVSNVVDRSAGPSKKKLNKRSELAPAGTLPDLDFMSRDLYRDKVLELAERCSVTIEGVWEDAANSGADPIGEMQSQSLLRLLLMRHTIDQLKDLCTELKVTYICHNRESYADVILESHRQKRLPCPKVLKGAMK